MIRNRLILLLMCVYMHNTLQFSLHLKDFIENEWFGAISIFDDTIVVGVTLADTDDLELTGGAYTFVRTDEGWTEEQRLKPEVPSEHDTFGSAVDIEEDTIVFGVSSHGDSGAVYIFERNEEGN